MDKMKRSVALEVPPSFFCAISQKNSIISPIILDTHFACRIFCDLYLANGRAFMTDHENGTLYKALNTLGRRLSQLFLVFIFYILGNLLSVGIFVVFFLCSMIVHWSTKKFDIPPDIGKACRGLELTILYFGVLSACFLLFWNTYNFIMDLVNMSRKD